MAFLDNTGLSHLWDKIKTALSGKLDTTGNAYRTASIPFAQVDDTSTSTVFTATVPGITELRSGVCVFLMNGVVTSASGFTVNINGLGAKPVYSTLAAASRSTTLFNVAYTLFLVYNEERVSGGCWDAYYGYDSNTNTIGYQLRTTATTMPTLDKFYRYRLLFTAADRNHFVPANTSSSTSADTAKTTTQRPIDPFGAIYYYGHTTAINANANPTTSYFWTQYSFALGYSFNRTGAALTLTNHAPVYIKCAPQSDGSAIIDADNPFVQTLPSTADGKIYIFLGIASSATAVELVPEHPVFCYRNGQIRLWTGNEESGSGGGDDVFIAVRGTTTEAEIREAHGAGKVVMCVYQNRVYYLFEGGETETIMLRTAPDAQGKVYALIVAGSNWTGINYDLALKSEIPTAAQMAAAAPVQSVNGKTNAVTLDANDVGAVDAESYTTDMDAVHSELNRKLDTSSLGAELDDVVGAYNHFLTISGTNTVTSVDTFINIAISFGSARQTQFLFVLARDQNGNPTSFVKFYPATLDYVNRTLALVGEYDGNRYTTTLTATSAFSTMTGTLVVEPIVTEADIPSLSGYATETWVQNRGYQTKAITDTGGYYTTDTVEGALQEIGAELAGVNTLIGTGVIT